MFITRLVGWAGRVAIVTTLGATLGSAGGALAQVGPELVDPDAKAAFQWEVPERYDASWAAYDSPTHGYDPDVIKPRGWSITLNACESRAVRRIERYTFVITGITVPTYKRVIDGAACDVRLHNLLPALGQYRVDVTVHTALGGSAPLSTVVNVRDFLIVSIGDSLASGEGVPDERGIYALGREFKAVQWKDRRCHRSARSGPALAARAIEHKSQHSSVTFVSFACSGADLKHLYNTLYPGAEQPAGTPEPDCRRTPSKCLSPQILDVRGLVGPGRPAERPIDALLVTGGINDLRFSTIIRACAKNNNLRRGHTDCVTGFAASKSVDTELPKRYDRLAAAVRTNLPNVREVYIMAIHHMCSRAAAANCSLASTAPKARR